MIANSDDYDYILLMAISVLETEASCFAELASEMNYYFGKLYKIIE